MSIWASSDLFGTLDHPDATSTFDVATTIMNDRQVMRLAVWVKGYNNIYSETVVFLNRAEMDTLGEIISTHQTRLDTP